MTETRLRQYFEAQYQALPEPEDRLWKIARTGRRRIVLRRTGFAFAGAATLLIVVIGFGLLPGADRAVAASPFSGVDLPVINETPVILQGELGPAPESTPSGVDLTFAPIEEPTANDLAAIDEIVRLNEWDEPVVVALGRIEGFDTNVYAVHNTDPDTGRGTSEVLAVGPDYPSFISVGGPTESQQLGWGPSANRGLDGDGFAFLRIPDYATWQYAQIEVDGNVSWQRQSDGFTWLPFEASLESTITLTAHDPATGQTLLEYRINP